MGVMFVFRAARGGFQRHMLDSLVAIMEEERLPVQHLPTIEDTRPTIRVPLYDAREPPLDYKIVWAC